MEELESSSQIKMPPKTARRSIRQPVLPGQVVELTISNPKPRSTLVPAGAISAETTATASGPNQHMLMTEDFLEIFKAAWMKILPGGLDLSNGGKTPYTDYQIDLVKKNCHDWFHQIGKIPGEDQESYQQTINLILSKLYKKGDFDQLASALIGFTQHVVETTIEFHQTKSNARDNEMRQRRVNATSQTETVSEPEVKAAETPKSTTSAGPASKVVKERDPEPFGTATVVQAPRKPAPEALKYTLSRNPGESVAKGAVGPESILSPANSITEINASHFGGRLNEVKSRDGLHEGFNDAATEPGSTTAETHSQESKAIRLYAHTSHPKSVHFDQPSAEIADLEDADFFSSKSNSPADPLDDVLVQTNRIRRFTDWARNITAFTRSRKNSSTNSSRRESINSPRSRMSTMSTRSRKSSIQPRSRKMSEAHTDDLPKLSSPRSKSRHVSDLRSRKSTIATVRSNGSGVDGHAAGGSKSRRGSVDEIARSRTSIGHYDGLELKSPSHH